jgi:hypothetical protein
MMYFHKSRMPAQLDRARLLQSLQLAIELEHATIPAYLYALYSLKPGENVQIAGLIESVVKEEMLHMLLACNLLNAFGGSPQLAHPKFFPRYPSRLPGAVAGRMRLGLEPFSLKLVKEVFMRIESPDRPLRLRRGRYTIPAQHRTIGDLYRVITRLIHREGSALFVGDSRRQVEHEQVKNLIAIKDADTALDAIKTIVEQGEGTSHTPTNDRGDYAHYYRFAEIYHGREIEQRKTGRSRRAEDRFSYTGDKVPFNPAGVWPVPRNPHRSNYSPDTLARRVCDTFNYTYTTMLQTLHEVVNGRQHLLRGSISQMFSLRSQALEMMSGEAVSGRNLGPTFEYQPLNPR